MPYLFTAAYESWIDYMDNGGRQHSNGTFVSDAVALFAKQWGFNVIPTIIYDEKNEFSEFFYSIKNHYGCDMDVLLDRMERDNDEKFACDCFIRFPVKYQKWFINWLNEGIECFIFATCDSYMEHPYTFNQPNNKTTYYYDEQVIDSPEDHIQQHYESDYEDSLPELEEVCTDDDDDDDDYDPYKNYYYDDPKKTNDDINDITPQQALDVIEKMDTPITFGSMSYDEALELQQNAEDTWNNNTGWNTYLDSNTNKDDDWDYAGGW